MKFRTLTCITAMTLFVALSLAGNAGAQTFTSLFSFDSTDGAGPEAGLVQATDGGLYGTTELGGANNYGTIFSITPAGMLATLHSFDGTDGEYPAAALVQATNGAFYGTTEDGGAFDSCDNFGVSGCGTVFKITPSGTLTTLHSFDSTDGSYPVAGLVQAAGGNLYGTTVLGGTGRALGTIFSITPTGALTTLDSLDSTDGFYPYAALVQASDGNLYGTAVSGGAGGDGTVFRTTPSGSVTTLYLFGGSTDGKNPYGGLAQGNDGNLYGTTTHAGAYKSCLAGDGCGTVFKISVGGTLRTLYSFCSQSGCPDGENPSVALIQATDGNFYGATPFGGANRLCNDGYGAVGCGTVFKIAPSGALTTLYSFCSQSGCTDGEEPDGALVQDTNGTFYGTTSGGGAEDEGTVFSLSVGLGPFVKTLPTSGKVGAAVGILGSDLKGATSVTFNGTAAAFKVSSHSLITTTVPAGATTGPVQVVTPSGTLSSNVPFRVTQ